MLQDSGNACHSQPEFRIIQGPPLTSGWGCPRCGNGSWQRCTRLARFHWLIQTNGIISAGPLVVAVLVLTTSESGEIRMKAPRAVEPAIMMPSSGCPYPSVSRFKALHGPGLSSPVCEIILVSVPAKVPSPMTP